MSKRSNFPPRPRDFWPTPLEAVLPLLPHLSPRTPFAEPCAGDGALVAALQDAGHVCALASDVAPQAPGIEAVDVFSDGWPDRLRRAYPKVIITNPPWTREVLHAMIVRFVAVAPAWLLFDSDWVHTKQAVPFLPYLSSVVSVGRVRWVPGSASTGKDNAAWHLFEGPSRDEPAMFWGRRV